MNERGEKFIPQELEAAGYSASKPKAAELSDKGEQAQQIIDRIAVEEMFEKSRLSEREKQVLRQHYLEDLPFKEIADQLSSSRDPDHPISAGRVHQINKRALKKLREFLPESLKLDLRSRKASAEFDAGPRKAPPKFDTGPSDTPVDDSEVEERSAVLNLFRKFGEFLKRKFH